MASPRILFILKQREAVTIPGVGLSNGLANSVRFIVEMLREEGIEAKHVEVFDNSFIHREVVAYKPDIVVIEALWVVPEKFYELQDACPTVKWIVRSHSEVPFLAVEGVAIDWIMRYTQIPGITFAANSPESYRDIRQMVEAARNDAEQVVYLPNFYPYHRQVPTTKVENEFLDVACFGAVRPLKNNLIQAVAALQTAEQLGKTLRFHINERPEQGGNNVVKNLEALFRHTPHQLYCHGWMSHEEFKETLRGMDIGLQVSFSETFNIVAADMLVSGLPIVTSPEIPWTTRWCQAEPTNAEDINRKMMRAIDWRWKTALQILNLRGLKHYCETSKSEWLQYLLGC